MKKTFTIFVIACVFLLPPLRPVFAADYDLYVDADADSGGDGSSDEPFRDIDEALDKAKKGDKIFVRKGTYDGDFTIDSDLSLRGESESKVRINGAIVMKNGSSISNVTISGGYSSITVKSGAKVLVEESTIKDFKKIGIDILPGNGELSVKKVKIHDGAGKGFYVEKGNKLQLSSSEIYDNGEEGVDIRSNVDGYISGNVIYNNGESGIEVILGSADLLIKDNVIKKNGASGIAAQYYEIANKLGGVKIESNRIESNKDFGITCKIPQKGTPSAGYWAKSLDVAKNDFQNNKEGRINSLCRLVEADSGDGGEEYDVADELSKESDEEDEDGDDIDSEQDEEEIQKHAEYLQTQLSEISKDFEDARSDANRSLKKIDKENAVWRWFWGVDQANLSSLKRNESVLEEGVAELDTLIVEGGDNPIVSQLQEKKTILEKDKDFIKERIAEEEKGFNLFGFFRLTVKKILHRG